VLMADAFISEDRHFYLLQLFYNKAQRS